MSQRIETEKDEDARCVHADRELAPSSHVRRTGETVIPFRRALPPLSPAAAGDPFPEEPAAFISLGGAVQAVIMRLANKRIRLRMLAPAREEE